MSQRNLRLTSILGNAITFADPLHAANTTRFDQTVSNSKQSNGLLPMQRSELISLQNLCVETNCGAVASATVQQSSVRVKISSPLASSAAVKQQVLDALENTRIAVEGGLLDGLKPDALTKLVADFGVA